jgi:hypothetical protein
MLGTPEYAESRLTARTQRNADGRVAGATIGFGGDDGALNEGERLTGPHCHPKPFTQSPEPFAAAEIGVAINGVYLRTLRSPLLRILRRSPRRGTARVART